MKKPTFERVEDNDNEKTKAASRLLVQAAELAKPDGREHLGSIALHFYAGTGFMHHKMDLITQRANWNLSTQAAGVFIEEIRDRIFEMLGASKLKLAPQTVEEAKDAGHTDAH